MRTTWFTEKMKYFINIIILLFVFNQVFSDDNVVNFYNWAGYIPNSVLRKFTKETGIKINFSVFDSNDELFAKMLAANNQSDYDVIVPSSNFVDRMRQQGMLEKLNKSKLSNFKNLNPALLNKPYDPHNNYSIPYFWGMTGIMVNRRYYPHLKITQWADLWDKNLKNQILMINEMKEPFEIALKVLHLPTNSRKPKQIKQAYNKLLQLLPNIKLFNITGPQAIFANGDVGIGTIYNGDAYLAMQKNPHLEFIFPKDGVFIWTDCMVIPKNAPHLTNAYRLINFLLRPDIAAQIAKGAGYSSPNIAALKYMPKNMRENTVLYPPQKILKKAHFEHDLGRAEEIYTHYWQLLKLAS